VEAAVRAQETAGIEPLTDGAPLDTTDPVEAWETTSSLTSRAVKQALSGPYSLAWAADAGAAGRTAATLANAAAGNTILRALAAAGCPLIEIHEPSATAIGADVTERALFREAHLRLLDGIDGTHLSLAITGGSADAAGIETILAAHYASLAVDLIAGPDNWRLVAAAPGEIGIVCGALSTAAAADDGPEVLLWAAAYAASTGARGPDRVGLATASSRGGCPPGRSPRARGRRVARPARRQQPGGSARIRRTGAVPPPGPGPRSDLIPWRCGATIQRPR
jgi:hypothetical protein